MTKKVLLIGHGKMGKELVSLMPKYDMEATHILVKTESIKSIPLDTIDLAIDFSSPEGILERSSCLFEHNIPLIQGTTGWEKNRDAILKMAVEKKSSLVWSNNFSPGLFLFKQIVERAAELLPYFPDFDAALLEAHHKKKKDAPSGTLLSLQKTLLNNLANKKPGCSSQKQPLEADEVDIATMRLGHIPGYHALWIDGPSETIQLTHNVRSRSVFAEGALLAATMLLETPGVYSFDDLLTQRILHV